MQNITAQLEKREKCRKFETFATTDCEVMALDASAGFLDHNLNPAGLTLNLLMVKLWDIYQQTSGN